MRFYTQNVVKIKRLAILVLSQPEIGFKLAPLSYTHDFLVFVGIFRIKMKYISKICHHYYVEKYRKTYKEKIYKESFILKKELLSFKPYRAYLNDIGPPPRRDPPKKVETGQPASCPPLNFSIF